MYLTINEYLKSMKSLLYSLFTLCIVACTPEVIVEEVPPSPQPDTLVFSGTLSGIEHHFDFISGGNTWGYTLINPTYTRELYIDPAEDPINPFIWNYNFPYGQTYRLFLTPSVYHTDSGGVSSGASWWTYRTTLTYHTDSLYMEHWRREFQYGYGTEREVKGWLYLQP